jgi:ketosteroid isomerase-like protein
MSNANLQLAREYLQALERGDVGESLRRFFTDDFVQEEYPNALNPQGQRSDLASALERSVRGKQTLRGQRYEIINAVADGDHVALEAMWTGLLAVPVGTLAAGAEMRAHFGVFLDFRGGKIARQRNYDSFDPWKSE